MGKSTRFDQVRLQHKKLPPSASEPDYITFEKLMAQPVTTTERPGLFRSPPLGFACIAAYLATTAIWGSAGGSDSFQSVESDFARTVRPLVKQFCLKCHATDVLEGDLDLERFESLAQVRRTPGVWQKVAEMLDNGEMPPKNSRQPTIEQRNQLRSWVERYLNAEAHAQAGDPGPIVLRRLNNAEYTYTIRDLTGVDLGPARDFPADSAAGEGFTNTGNSLVMSPALLTKYLDAGKEIARHAVLLPDGFRFSPSTTRRDWTEEILREIRELYASHSISEGGTQVNLQGIVFNTNGGGRLPVEKYFAATLAEREALSSGRRTVESVANEHGLSPKYLGFLWSALNGREPSLLLDSIRRRWGTAKVEDAMALAGEVARWQQSLWRFSSVGHIGKLNGPKGWMEPVGPLTARQELKVKLPPATDAHELVLFLAASDAGDGNEQDFVVWERPRLVATGRSELLLRDVRAFVGEWTARRERIFAIAANCLHAAAEASATTAAIDPVQLSAKYSVEEDALAAWLEYLGIGTGEPAKLGTPISRKMESAAGYDFIKGWVGDSALSVVANSSDNHVRIPGNMKPHGVAVHPSPTQQVVIGWHSPLTAMVRIEGQVQHAHPECGNGVAWTLELRRGNTRQRLAAGTAQGANAVKFGPLEKTAVRPGDVVSIAIGPRDGNHACDLTAVDLTIADDDANEWNLAGDISPNILAGNPHADLHGNADVWTFTSEPATGAAGHLIPPGSLIARWQSAPDDDDKRRLAEDVQRLLKGVASPPPKDSPDAMLARQLASMNGPLCAVAMRTFGSKPLGTLNPKSSAIGPDPELFGKHSNGSTIDRASLCVRAPSAIELRLPADLVEGAELVVSGTLHSGTGNEGSVQLQVLTANPDSITGPLPPVGIETNVNGQWTSQNRRLSHATPFLVNEDTLARRRIESAFDDFRKLFPAALCYTKIVPVDEVVTLTLFHREDDSLRRLMLDDAEIARLDRLWDEMHFVSHDALTLVDAFDQLWQYATQDADPKVFEPLRKPINDRATAFRKRLTDTEPMHVDALLAFAELACRRPLHEAEAKELRGLYRKLREQDLPHEEAIQFTLARVFVSPAFLYRLEQSKPPDNPSAPRAEKPSAQKGNRSSVTSTAASDELTQGASSRASHPVSEWELATRLSYFLWSSKPDSELRDVAAAGRLHEPDELAAQARRMLRDGRVRRLATEFACQWLQIYEFDKLDEKSERHFPMFAELRGDMYEESIRFFTDLFQRDVSVLSILDADHTFSNEALAKHYGFPDVTGPDWQRVDGVRKNSRGGILGFATTLAKQSGASRTSPILRGNWVSEVLLGERLPRPPKDVPRLPEDETATDGLTVRQLVERHSSDPLCAKCHTRIDPFGLALEGFDAIGRRRDKDLGDRSIDTRAKIQDGTEFEGLDGLRGYLLTTRRGDFVRQFCRKLLGYALGRGVQLSDGPLIDEMQRQLKQHDYRFSVAVDSIVRSRQFREIRVNRPDLAEAP